MSPPDDLTSPPTNTASPSSVQETEFPTLNSRWKGTPYLVLEELPPVTGAPAWRASNTVTNEEVRLVAARSSGVVRDKAYQQIQALQNASILRPLDSHLARGLRIDTYSLQPPPSLRSWRAGGGKVTPDFINALLSTLVELLETLHGQGIGHFNLRPDTIHVVETEQGTQFMIGGWDTATLVAQKDLIPIPVDAFFAPPEAAGLTRHSPGEDLYAWDWWSVGRIIQELILGHHVIGSILGCDVSQPTSELRQFAEDLLQGKNSGTNRPGAVEAMKLNDARITLLLHGLLVNARDARWRASECRLWLAGESPKEHYQLNGKERCFRWQTQAYTVAEAAETLKTDANWEHAAAELLQADNPASLIAFIRKNSPTSLCAKLDETFAFQTDEAFAEFPPPAVREVVIMLALVHITGGKLIWRGRRIEPASIKELLQREDGSGQWLGAICALTSTPILCLLDKIDAEAGRIFTDLGKLATKVIEQAFANNWAPRSDFSTIARIWQLSCEHPTALQGIRDELKRSYACSSNPQIDSFFQEEKNIPEDAVMLAFMASNPSAFGFVSHEKWAGQEYLRLYEQGMESSRCLFWRRLRKTLRLGPWWYGSLLWVALAWGGIALFLSAIFPGPTMAILAILPLVLAIGIRVGLAAALKSTLTRWSPGHKPWRWLDGPGRCVKEEHALAMHLRSDQELRIQIAAVNANIEKLSVIQPPPSPVPPPPRFIVLSLAAINSWVVLILLCLFCNWQARIHPPSWENIYMAWSGKTAEDIQKERALAAALAAQVPWPHKPSDDARVLTPHSVHPASPEEREEALARGRALVLPFKRETILAPILVRIPQDEKFGYMVFDGAKNQLSDKTVFVLLFNPMPRSWAMIGGYKVYILPE